MSGLARVLVCAIGMVPTACRLTDDASYAIQRIALDTLFNGREHSRELVVWSSDSVGPALEAILPQQHLQHTRLRVDRLNATIPATAIDEQTIARLFREHPDGWEEFFRRHPRSSGLVELSPVRFSSGESAEVFVGRSCGRHCQNAWRVVVRRDPVGTWRVTRLQWVAVPGT